MRNGDTVVARYEVSTTDPNRADPASAETILSVDQPAANHNGGLLLFGPQDGYLYIGLGDGGGGNGQNGQDLSTLLGKILRIDVDGTSGDLPYSIPPDNPFVDQPGARPEIWALGVRNPWRFSFDRDTGDLWIGDVGSATYEEVNQQPGASAGGENYGWDQMEGTDLPRRKLRRVCGARLRVRSGRGLCRHRRLCLPGERDTGSARRLPVCRLLQRPGLGTGS